MTDKLLVITTLLVSILASSFPLRAADQASRDKPNPPKPAKGGIYLYNQRQDQQAQQVQKMAADVAKSQLFDAENSNLDNLSQYSAERIFTSDRRAAMATRAATVLGSDIKHRVDQWNRTLLIVKQVAGTSVRGATT